MLICVIIGTSDREKIEFMLRGVNKLVENQESSKYLIKRLEFQNQELQIQLRNSKLTHEAEISSSRDISLISIVNWRSQCVAASDQRKSAKHWEYNYDRQCSFYTGLKGTEKYDCIAITHSNCPTE